MSRWLQQNVQPQYPNVALFEILEADYGYYQVDQGTCHEWMSDNGLSHPVLRDRGQEDSIAELLDLEEKEMMVLDRQLKIVYKGRVTDSFAQNAVLEALSQLP